jgi:gliding-associated putative ABC transporter substrate-binding component GldG
MKPNNVWVRLSLLAAVVVGVNLLGAEYFWRWDLTAEKRYTLSPVTYQTLDSLQQPTLIRVYAEGDFPPTVKRFQQALHTTLAEMKAYAGSALRVQYVDPREDTAARRRFAVLGLQPLPIRTAQSELQRSEAYLYPFASVVYGGQEEVIDLLKGTLAEKNLEILLRAEQELEYKFTGSLRRLALHKKYTVGLLTGHKEYNRSQIPYFLQEAAPFYDLLDVNLRTGKPLLPAGDAVNVKDAYKLDALLVAQPDAPFTEREKFALDQYLMRGGNILWLLDQQRIDEMTLEQKGATLTAPRQLNLDDQFLKYGFKVNYDLVQDALCGYIDVIRTVNGRDITGQEKWIYFPLLRSLPSRAQAPHPITKNIDAVLMRYASTIDTLPVAGITKTVLLRSSALSRTQQGSILIDLGRTILNPPTPQSLRGKGGRIMGVALAGNFKSVFAGRDVPTDTDAPQPAPLPLVAQSNGKGRMVVLADGALVVGNHSKAGNPGLPVDNKTLLLNSIDWLIGDAALTDIRARDITLRTLDPEKVRGHELQWRLLNVALPVALVLLYGAVRWWWRRRKYAR